MCFASFSFTLRCHGCKSAIIGWSWWAHTNADGYEGGAGGCRAAIKELNDFLAARIASMTSARDVSLSCLWRSISSACCDRGSSAGTAVERAPPVLVEYNEHNDASHGKHKVRWLNNIHKNTSLHPLIAKQSPFRSYEIPEEISTCPEISTAAGADDRCSSAEPPLR